MSVGGRFMAWTVRGPLVNEVGTAHKRENSQWLTVHFRTRLQADPCPASGQLIHFTHLHHRELLAMIIQHTGGALESSDPSDPVDSDNCRLLGPVALVVQAVMGIIVVLSLVYKRHREKPPRPWRIWYVLVSSRSRTIANGYCQGYLTCRSRSLVKRSSTL